jgi:hypothetical protein
MDQPRLRAIGISDFLRWNAENTLVLSPKFQRRRIWPRKAKAFLIDTILRGLPIPKLYMRQQLDLRSEKTIHEIVDGQQRLSAVLEYRADGFALLRDNEPWGPRRYSELPGGAQKAFLKYEFSVDLLVDAADADILDIFARINSYAVPLNAQERRNAKFFGSFKSVVYGLGFQHLEFWKKHGILSDTSIARMREAELTSELLVAMADGLQDKKKSLDAFYDRWEDRYPYKQKSVARFQDIIDLIDRYLGDDLRQSNFRRPALFYTLFLALYQLRYGELGDLEGSKKAFGDEEGRRLKEALRKLDEIVENEEPPAGYQAFVEASQRQTDNIAPRRARHRRLLRTYEEIR